MFIAPKREVIENTNRIRRLLEDRGWSILQIVEVGSKVNHDLVEKCDIVLTLGGDGTILYASRELEGTDVPILGINFGKIGLLTELNPKEFLKSIELIERKQYRIFGIKRLKAIRSDGKEYPTVLNEYVVMTRSPGKILGLEIYLDGEHIGDVLCDGLVISTPIGSSSYALSSGGPVVLDTMEAMVLVPIAPLFRGMYPLVLPSNVSVSVKVRKLWMDAILIADGVIVDSLPRGSSVSVCYSDYETKFIKLGKRYDRIKRLMGLLSVKKWLMSDETT